MASSPPVLTLTVTVFGPVPVVPEDGVTVSQGASSLIVQFKVPRPLFVILRVCGVGLDPPSIPTKESVVGLLLIFGVGATTVRLTCMWRDVVVAPEVEIVIVPVYVLAGNPEMFTMTLITSLFFVLPDVGVTVSHGASSVADRLSCPLPVLVMFNVCEDGFAPPCTAVKDKSAALTSLVLSNNTQRSTMAKPKRRCVLCLGAPYDGNIGLFLP